MACVQNVLQMSCLCLLFHYLLVGVSAAPVAEFSGQYGYLSADHTFQQFLTNNLEFIAKIKDNSESLRSVLCQELQLCREDELTLLKEELGLYPTSLDQCQSSSYNLEDCLNQAQSSLQTYHSRFVTLEEVLGSSSTQNREAASHLRYDLEDLKSNFKQQMELMSIVPVNYPAPEISYPTLFHKRAGSYILLRNLQYSLETLIRALRLLQRQ